MADHEHGKMDISVQERTFETFMTFVKWGVIIIALALIFLALVNG